MPVALEIVVKQLTDSGIIAPGKLENFVPPKADPKDGEALLRELYKQGLLTKFQAQQFAQNRARSLILGNYTLIDKIGAGGMGQVFKAEHRRLKRVVAIKMLPKALLQDAAAVARFQREVEAAAKLRHSNVVATDDADEAGGTHFLVMEYVEGADLSALVKKDGPLPVNKAINYILQTARGLEFAHGEGVVHRDIKPANLLLDKKGVVKILDMGLARISGDGNAGAQAELTGTGAVMGTIDYMAPEQGLSTKHADARADIYSLGCSLHYLLIAKPTFDGETITAKLLAHHHTPPPNLCDLRSDVPSQLQVIFAKMVAKKLEDRYQSMTAVIADLESCHAGQSGKALAAGESGISPASATVKTSSSPDTHTSEMTAAFGDRLLQAIPAVERYVEPESKGPPWKNARLLIGAGAAGFLFLLLGVIVIVRDKDGKEVSRVEVPEGGTLTVETQSSPKDAAAPATTAPTAPSPAVATTMPAVRWPLAPSKPEDIKRLFDAEAEVTLRTGATQDKLVKRGDALPAGPATVVGVKLAGGPEPTDDGLLGIVAGFTDLEELYFERRGHTSTTQGLLKLRSLVELRRLSLHELKDRAAGGTDLLKSLPHLEFIRLPYGTKVAEEWAAAVAARPSITEVDAYRAGITDAGVADLEKMPQLRKLGLADNDQITEAAIERLVAALPNCRIEYGSKQDKSVRVIEPRTPPANRPASLTPGATGSASAPPLASAPKGPASLPASIPAGGANSGDVDRAVAEWVIAGGGEAGVLNRGYIKKLGDLPAQPYVLTEFRLGQNQQITVADARRLTALPRLEGIQMSFGEISPQAITELRDCPRLHRVLFDHSKFQPGALEAILTLKRLVHVAFTLCDLPDAFVMRLGELPNLRELSLYGDGAVTDKGLIALANSPPPKLASLGLAAVTKVSAAGLSAIATVPHLEKLALDRRKWDDQALRALAAAKGLAEISLKETQVTRAGVDWLHETLGNCQVHVSTVEQAGKLNGPAYQTAFRKLRARGFTFNLDGGNSTGNVYLTPDSPWREGGPITVQRAALPATVSLDDLRDLAQLLDLELISGYGGKLPAGSLRELLPLKNLTQLSTGEAPLTSDEVQLLFSFPKLRSVERLCVDDDASIATIARLPHLTKLTISAQSKITDACLNSLAGVATLHELTLHPTSTITRPAIEAFAAARPDVTVTWNNIVIEPPVASGLGASGAANAPPLAKAPFDAAGAKAHQAAWAKYLATTVESKNSVGMTLVLIPPGEFLMGSTDEQVEAAKKMAEDDKVPTDGNWKMLPEEMPQHKVTISRPFLIGSTEVTVAQFRKFVEASKYVTEAEKYGFGNSNFKAIEKTNDDNKGKNWKNPGYPIIDDAPVTQVTWNDAAAYCAWLSEQEQRQPWYRPDGSGDWLVAAPADGYRLPTEAEWEYACRAGTTTQYAFGDDRALLGQYGWFLKNSGNRVNPVALKLPNPFGLFDMHGNAQEWCQDCYDAKWYEKQSSLSAVPSDPSGPSSSYGRVLRGGVYFNFAYQCRSATRSGNAPWYRISTNGFRIVRVLDAVPAGSAVTGPASLPASIPAGGANSGDVDRAVAEWVIAGGGRVDILNLGNISKRADLPAQPFQLGPYLFLGNNQQLTPADAQRLAALTRLEVLFMAAGEITPQAIIELRACPRLNIVSFNSTKFQPGALEAVLTLKRLVQIEFLFCSLPDAFVPRLAELPNLRELRFFGAGVTDEGLIGLAKSPPPKLTYLDLSGTTKVTAAGMSTIAMMRQLDRLDLQGKKLDDQELRALAAAKGLSEINLLATKVTRADVDWLHETLDNCLVRVSKAEQAGTLNGPAYKAVIRKLLARGFVFVCYLDGTGVDRLKQDTPWPEGRPIAAIRATLPATTSLDDLRDLAQLLDLQSIGGSVEKLPPGSLRELLPLKNLTELPTRDVLLTSDDVQLLASFPKLRLVSVRVDSDASIASIAKLPHLTKLTIDAKSKITDACLKSLAGVATLDALTLYANSPITRPAVEAFAAARPDVTVTWNNIVIEPPAASGLGASGAANAPPLAKAPFDAAGAKAHQAAWAKYLATTVESKNSVGMTLVLIPPGEFLMGSTDEQVEAALKVAEEMKASQYDKVQIQETERPQHRVVITKPFLMGSTEVTIGQFKTFSAASGYLTEAEQAAAKDPKLQTYLNPGYPVTDDLPAACISWNDAAAYGKWLSEQEKSTYRLPTEAEWEYACRAGTTTQYSFGDDRKQLSQFGWHDKNADKAKPVGTKLPNGFGLHDMHGNLWEWCQDLWDDKWYEKSPINDPNGPVAGSTRVLRGGRWYGSPSNCRSAYRNHLAPSYYVSFSPGFRIVRVVDGTADSRFATGTTTRQPNQPWDTPAFQAWAKEVQALPAKKQVDAVVIKLMELNPGFDGKVAGVSEQPTPNIISGKLIGLRISSDDITDISPVRALPALKGLQLDGKNNSKLSDLSPLRGMPLTNLGCRGSQVSDLSPLRGMPLTILNCRRTQVSDLSPLQGMPLEELKCSDSQVSDLSPLQGASLIEIWITPKNITKGLDVIRQMKTLKTISVGEKAKDKFPPDDFWKRYDAGEFGKPAVANQP